MDILLRGLTVLALFVLLVSVVTFVIADILVSAQKWETSVNLMSLVGTEYIDYESRPEGHSEMLDGIFAGECDSDMDCQLRDEWGISEDEWLYYFELGQVDTQAGRGGGTISDD